MRGLAPVALASCLTLSGAIALSGGLVAAQQSQALFDTPLVVLGPFEPAFDRLLDVDGDAFPDALGLIQDTALDTATFALYRNDGTGVFSGFWSGTLNDDDVGPFTSTAVGDLDGDGRDDFAIAQGDRVYAFRTQGLAAPQPLTPIALPPAWGDARERAALEVQGNAPRGDPLGTDSSLHCPGSNGALVPLRDAGQKDIDAIETVEPSQHP